jgi:hypothetical protein
VSVYNGVYDAVRVIIMYADGQHYSYDAGGMGGSNATVKPFYLFPDKRYAGQNPEYYIQLGDTVYSTQYEYGNGGIIRIATSADALAVPPW